MKRHIREGNVYQINFTGHFHFGVVRLARDLFEELVRRLPIPYGAYIDTGGFSASRRSFFFKQDDHILARPMKGTAPRGASPNEDRRLEAWRSRALLFATERYETLIQMTSEVEGRLLPETGTADIFRALSHADPSPAPRKFGPRN